MLPDAIGELTAFLYGPEKGADVASALRGLLDAFPGGGRPREPLSEKDAVLIAYPDQFTGRDMPPLRYMRDFADRFLGDAVSAIPLLPFSPYTSDDGFSVSDYRAVEPGQLHVQIALLLERYEGK